MKKHILLAMLIIISISSQTFGQNIEYFLNSSFVKRLNNRTRTERMFNSSADAISHTHSVDMQDGAELFFEITSVYDYEVIKNLDSIVADVNKMILSYGDSIDARPHDNVRIDYVIDGEHNNTRLRYIVYPPSSDMFISRRGEVSRLKVEQDTVRIRILTPLPKYPERSDTVDFQPFVWKDYKPTFPVQITFLLNHYTDLFNLTEEYELNEFVDTFYKLTQPTRKRDRDQIFPWHNYKTIAHIRSTTQENIQAAGKAYGTNDFKPYHGPIVRVNFYGNIGAGLVQNKLAPVAEVGLEYRWLWTKGEYDYSFLNLNVSPYFLFDRHTDGTYHTYDSWFVNFFGGASTDNNIFNIKTKREYWGAGYLINPNGINFKRTTFKIFMGIQFRNSITIVPEVIVTDNFKSIFPGITVKIF